MMGNSIFEALGGQPRQVQQPQNPRSAAMERMKDMGIDVPKGMENNPQALIQHVMQSGRVPSNRLNMAQQVMQRLMERR